MAFKDFFPPQAPTVASNNAVVLKGWRERSIAELHRWEDCGFASSADDIADRIVEQPVVVVMPLEWRHDPGNGKGGSGLPERGPMTRLILLFAIGNLIAFTAGLWIGR